MGRDLTDNRMIAMVANWLSANMDNTTNTKNEIREPLKYVYPLFIFLHALVAICAISGNICIIINVVRDKLYRSSTHFFIANLAISDIIKALFVMPLTLTNLLIKHWVFGSFMCYFIPMLQSFPVYASMLTYLVIAIDRYRQIMYPMKSRIPAALSIIATWILSICIVLPQAIYLQYFDIGRVSPKFAGLGICLVSLEKNYEEYIRAMFVILYAMPLCCIAFLYIKISAELKALYYDSIAHYHAATLEEPVVHARSLSEASYHSKLTFTTPEDSRIDPEGASGGSVGFHEERFHNDSDLDIIKEKRTQKYLITMSVVFAACWCPLNILYLVTPFLVPEEDEESMDITFITLSWIGFLSTCAMPLLYASWHMSDITRDRLREYFHYRRPSSASSACQLPVRSHSSQRGTPSRRSDQRAFL